MTRFIFFLIPKTNLFKSKKKLHDVCLEEILEELVRIPDVGDMNAGGEVTGQTCDALIPRVFVCTTVTNDRMLLCTRVEFCGLCLFVIAAAVFTFFARAFEVL